MMTLLMQFFDYLALIIAIISLIVALFAAVKILGLRAMMQKFFSGKTAGNLENFILSLNEKLAGLSLQSDIIEKTLAELREKQLMTIQKIGLVRYNPFEDNGGNLSFSLAILDGKNNGIIITSMHGREHNRIYSKPILNGKSEFSLTAEEQRAIESSKNL